MKTSVILGQSQDAQVGLVVERLRALSAPVFFVDADEPPDFSVDVDEAGKVRCAAAGQAIEPARVWARIKFSTSLGENLERSDAFLRESEWLAFASGLSGLYPDRMLHGSGAAGASFNKLSQLRLAGQAGFRVPRTTAFLGKGAALDFLAHTPFAVLKAIGTPRLIHPTLEGAMDPLITTTVDLATVRDANPDEFRVCPVMFQARIDNASELRVIAFSDHVFSYELVDAPGVTALVDRRMMAPGYRLVAADGRLKALVAGYLRVSGLRYGAFDILRTEHDYVFLECNPEGQWHSANELNLPEVIAAFADYLAAYGPDVSP